VVKYNIVSINVTLYYTKNAELNIIILML